MAIRSIEVGTTTFPRGGETVEIGEGVHVIERNFGDLGSRGLVIYRPDERDTIIPMHGVEKPWEPLDETNVHGAVKAPPKVFQTGRFECIP